MAEVAATGNKLKVSGNLIFNFIIASIIFALFIYGLTWFMNKDKKPEGALTQSEFDALSAEQKALYEKKGDFWVKKA